MSKDFGRDSRLSQAEPVARLGPSGFDPAREERLIMMGLGLGSALAVTDSWDHYTRNRIKAPLEDARG